MQVQELVGIVPWTFLAQIANLFIQVLLIKRFLFKPVNEILKKGKSWRMLRFRKLSRQKKRLWL